MRRGRAIEERDGAGAQTVVVVNEVFVERFSPGRNPVGRTLTMTLEVPDGEFTFDPKAIVGIVGNAVHESIREPIRPIVYLPMAQEPLQSLFVAGVFIAVRSEAASPERLRRSLAAALEGSVSLLKTETLPARSRASIPMCGCLSSRARASWTSRSRGIARWPAW